MPAAPNIFWLPGSVDACKNTWDEILVHQLNYRHRPCNFVEYSPAPMSIYSG